MRLATRDAVATGLVAAALALTVLSATDVTSSTTTGIRATGVGVLALGFIASAAAVVPSFLQLLRGSKLYLVGTSILGAGALGVGVHLLVTASATSLAILTALTVVLWLVSTIHHTVQQPTAGTERPPRHGLTAGFGPRPVAR